jgi:indolepyruvate ferredoxin oxidoreductase alpha subunit
MGASITQAQGIGRAEPGRKSIAVLGDSTFYHTGIPGLLNAVYNQFPLTLVIMDNSTTAMTGFQPHAGTGVTAMGQEVPAVDMVQMIKGCGVKSIQVLDPVNHKDAVQAVKQALDEDGPSVVIMKRACINLPGTHQAKVSLNAEKCKTCGLCVTEIGCPALVMHPEEIPEVLDTCTGCGLCTAVCPFTAIEGGNKLWISSCAALGVRVQSWLQELSVKQPYNPVIRSGPLRLLAWHSAKAQWFHR